MPELVAELVLVGLVAVPASLAVAEKRTLLVDLDPQANATSGVGVDPNRMEQTVYHALLGAVPVSDLRQTTNLDPLHLLPSNPDLIGAEVEELRERGKVG